MIKYYSSAIISWTCLQMIWGGDREDGSFLIVFYFSRWRWEVILACNIFAGSKKQKDEEIVSSELLQCQDPGVQ